VIRLPKKFGVLVAHDALDVLAVAPAADQRLQPAQLALITPRSFFQEERISDV